MARTVLVVQVGVRVVQPLEQALMVAAAEAEGELPLLAGRHYLAAAAAPGLIPQVAVLLEALLFMAPAAAVREAVVAHWLVVLVERLREPCRAVGELVG